MIPVRARRDWVLSSPHAQGLIGLWVPTPGGFADLVQANHAHARAGAPLQAIDPQRRRAWRFASGQYFTAGSSTPQLTGNLVGVGDGFSWAAWVKFSSGGGAYQMVMTRAAGSGAAWEIARDLSGGTAAQLYFSASGTHTAATTAVSLEEWHLWHLSADGWFVDGRLNTGSASATPITAGGAIQFNARANSQTGTHAIGRVFLWDRKQSAAEIASFYRSEIGNTERRIWVPVSAVSSVSLTVADATHAHTVDGLVLTSSTALSVADATHAHAADAITLVVGSVLTVAEASHAHAADSLTLTAASALAVADATHSHAADNITLSVAGATNLTVADALHSHAADALALTSAHALTVADATHGHAVDGLTLTAASVLAIQEALHAHAADNVTLDAGGAVNLLLADGLHAHTADGVALTVAAWLAVADALHGHAADNVVLTFAGPTVLSAPPLGHGPAAARRINSAGRSRAAQLSTRTR